MGGYNSVYVGVYIDVEGGTEMVTETKLMNPKTGKEMKTKFDSNTGVEAVTESFTRRKVIEPSAYIQDEGYDYDLFWEPAYTGCKDGHGIFILNSTGNKYAKCFDETKALEIHESMNIEQLLLEFRREHKKYLDYYKSKYKSVEVKYGVVYYAH
jgi:hypothetical protein